MADYDETPPTKASLLRWRNAFARVWNGNAARPNKQPAGAPPLGASVGRGAARGAPMYSPGLRGLKPGQDGRGRVFGVRLEDSLQYASVAISMVAPDGKQYVYGYVPIVVAKCGMMLKETATQTEGIFRVSGSNKRINELQAIFDQPPRYGKDFDWTGYSVHDAASVLRRYLNSLPDPVIPANLYIDFTAVLQQPQPIAASIAAYRHLISLLPPASRYLLLYLLDFLSVFARCADKNLMTASNLAVVFQPGLVSSRTGGNNALLGFPGFVEGRMPPGGSSAAVSAAARKGGAQGAQEQAGEHSRGKEVLEFLIEQQAHFMLGLEPPVDEERQKRKGVEIASPTPSMHAELERQDRGQAQQDLLASAGPSGSVGGSSLQRRGSEKSVERRKLRKSKDSKEGDGKVKRSKTWGSSSGRRKRGEGREGSPSPNPTAATSSPIEPSPAIFAPSTSQAEPTVERPAAAADSLAPPSQSSPAGSPQLGYRPSVKKARRSATSTREEPATTGERAASRQPSPKPASQLAVSTSSRSSRQPSPVLPAAAAPRSVTPSGGDAPPGTTAPARPPPAPGPTLSQAVLAARQARSERAASPPRSLGLGLGFGKTRRKSGEPVTVTGRAPPAGSPGPSAPGPAASSAPPPKR